MTSFYIFILSHLFCFIWHIWNGGSSSFNSPTAWWRRKPWFFFRKISAWSNTGDTLYLAWNCKPLLERWLFKINLKVAYFIIFELSLYLNISNVLSCFSEETQILKLLMIAVLLNQRCRQLALTPLSGSKQKI